MAVATCLDILNSRGVIPYNTDSPEVFPFLSAYFLVTIVLFVIGIRNLFPGELKTKIPFIYFPTNRAGWTLVFRGVGRMLAWSLGGAAIIGPIEFIRYLLQ